MIAPAMSQTVSVDEKSVQPAGPCVMVIFGAAGDLTKRLLMPSLYLMMFWYIKMQG